MAQPTVLAPGLVRVTRNHEGWSEIWIETHTCPSHLFGIDWYKRACREFADCGPLSDVGTGRVGMCVAVTKGPNPTAAAERIEEFIDAASLKQTDLVCEITEPFFYHDKGFDQVKLVCPVISAAVVLLFRRLHAEFGDNDLVAVWKPCLTLTTWSYSPATKSNTNVVTIHRAPCQRHKHAIAAVAVAIATSAQTPTPAGEPCALPKWADFPVWLRIMLRIAMLLWITLAISAAYRTTQRAK